MILSSDITKLPIDHSSANHYQNTTKSNPKSTNRVDIKKKDDDSVEVWKLRCKFLAEKYFNTLKDMKIELDTFKQ
jgi:hypothetical protein